jgi:hypothetical protein
LPKFFGMRLKPVVETDIAQFHHILLPNAPSQAAWFVPNSRGNANAFSQKDSIR